ncbi:unnamed protein product [Pleuronectes platessa]|uniref:Uncharacterized protein n=1 Tax=Pleuronectes platessa TaxID=8262 RepID=A0A9N7VFH4_PLEPL|nr:unnamed protein product [Pleuronectes platessa]
MRRRTFQFRRLCTSCRSNAGFTPDAEATPKRGVSANPWRAGGWLVTPDARCGLTWEWMGARGLALRFTPRFGVASASGVNPATEGCYSLSLLHRQGGGLADPASFSIQPTTGGQRCSSQLTPLKEISSPFKLYKTPRSDAMSCRKTSTSI